MSDLFYQKTSVANSDIVIIGIDSKSLNKFGEWPWSREIIATCLEELAKNENEKPGVVGIDTIYPEKSGDVKVDEIFLNAVQKHERIVLASNVEYGTQIVDTAHGFYLNNDAIVSYNKPYEELEKVSTVAHVNAKLDVDGVLRHAIWEIELANGEIVPSFNQAIYHHYMNFKGEDNLIVPKTDSDENWYVPFQTKAHGYDDGYSVYDLYNGDIDPLVYKDKIVLIGPYAADLKDSYRVSIDRAEQMYGVEFQANAVGALLNEDSKYEMSKVTQTIILMAVTFLFFVLCSSFKIGFATICFVLISICYVLYANLMFKNDYILDLIYIPISLIFIYLMSIIFNYLIERKEREKIEYTVKQYVDPNIVDKLLKEDKKEPELGGELKEIVVFFMDIRGFTSLAESLEAPVVVEVLNKYLNVASNCILDNKGILDKFMGDCIMAFWEVNNDALSANYNALKASMEIIEKTNLLNEEIGKQYEKDLKIGIGINYGSAVVGNIGSSLRMDYTCIGDVVNIASRIENIAYNEILVTKSVKDIMKDKVDFSIYGEEIKLKGKNEKIQVFKVESKIEKID